jgi:hypothetical protein
MRRVPAKSISPASYLYITEKTTRFWSELSVRRGMAGQVDRRGAEDIGEMISGGVMIEE